MEATDYFKSWSQCLGNFENIWLTERYLFCIKNNLHNFKFFFFLEQLEFFKGIQCLQWKHLYVCFGSIDIFLLCVIMHFVLKNLNKSKLTGLCRMIT